jgi:hypothetical protein
VNFFNAVIAFLDGIYLRWVAVIRAVSSLGREGAEKGQGLGLLL